LKCLYKGHIYISVELSFIVDLTRGLKMLYNF
jgi:hypothetical protein